jgi:hypothetical protein
MSNSNIRKIKYLLPTLCLAGLHLAHAELPLIIEDLLTDKGKVKLDLSVTYANRDHQGLSTGNPITLQTAATSFVTIPSLISESQGNTDTLVGTASLRYGFSEKIEIYGHTSYLYTNNRTSDLSGLSSSSGNRFVDAWAGINYLIKKDDELPGVVGFGEVALREKHIKSNASFKSWMLGATTYKAIDPVVLSLTTAYRFHQVRKDGLSEYKPGNVFLINPSLAFSVNDRVTLTTGLQWTNRQSETFNNQVQGFRRTSTDLVLATGYFIGKANTVNFTFKTNVSGRDGADLRLNWSRMF